MAITEVAGFAGAGLAGAAYVPQISHLIRAHCSAGISRLAFAAWLLSSVLVTARAIAIGAGVFVVLGGIQIVATALIMFYAVRYKDAPCPSHPPARPGSTTGRTGRETGAEAFRSRPRLAVAGPGANVAGRANAAGASKLTRHT